MNYTNYVPRSVRRIRAAKLIRLKFNVTHIDHVFTKNRDKKGRPIPKRIRRVVALDRVYEELYKHNLKAVKALPVFKDRYTKTNNLVDKKNVDTTIFYREGVRKYVACWGNGMIWTSSPENLVAYIMGACLRTMKRGGRDNIDKRWRMAKLGPMTLREIKDCNYDIE